MSKAKQSSSMNFVYLIFPSSSSSICDFKRSKRGRGKIFLIKILMYPMSLKIISMFANVIRFVFIFYFFPFFSYYCQNKNTMALYPYNTYHNKNWLFCIQIKHFPLFSFFHSLTFIHDDDMRDAFYAVYWWWIHSISKQTRLRYAFIIIAQKNERKKGNVKKAVSGGRMRGKERHITLSENEIWY